MSATDKGINDALAHANRKTEKWSDQAYDALRTMAERGRSFTAPDLRRAARGCVPDPPTNMAWGGVFLRAKREGIIIPDGFSEHNDDTMHSQPVRRWIAP